MVNYTYTNLSKLGTMQPPTFNMSNFTSSQTAIDMTKETARDNVGNFWFLMAIIVIFLYLVWLFYRQDNVFLLDITRAIFISAIWSFFISAAFLLGGWINTIDPLFWFSAIFLICIPVIRKLQQKGL